MRKTKKKAAGGRRIITIINPSTPIKLTNGGKTVARKAKRRNVKSRRRTNPATKVASASTKRTNPARKRSRRRNSATALKVSRRRNGASRRSRRFLNPALSGIGDIITQSAIGAAGAFSTNTIAAIVPINFSSPMLNLVKKFGAGVLTGMLFNKLFGKKNGDAALAGGMIAVALDAGALLFPNLITPPVFAVPNVFGGLGNTLRGLTGGAPTGATANNAVSGIVDFDPDAAYAENNMGNIVAFDPDTVGAF